jgi:rare lipoprotein A
LRKIHAWVLALLACAEIAEGQPRPRKKGPMEIAFGEASWYGFYHQGRLMANGRPFQAMGETAASLIHPLGTWVRITNLSNGLSAIVQITDRGPFVHDRIIDVSLGTARRLDMVKAGVVRVRVEVVPDPKAG